MTHSDIRTCGRSTRHAATVVVALQSDDAAGSLRSIVGWCDVIHRAPSGRRRVPPARNMQTHAHILTLFSQRSPLLAHPCFRMLCAYLCVSRTQRSESPCNCAHPEQAFKCAAKPVKRVNSHALRKRMKKREMSLCQHYKVNMHAATVGECIHCGRPRAEHSEAALKATLKEGPTTEKRTDADIQSHMKSPAKDNLAWECAKYVVNLQAVVTGECICGRSRGEHKTNVGEI